MTIEALDTLGRKDYRILLTIVRTKPMQDGENARSKIVKANLPTGNKEKGHVSADCLNRDIN